jgi:hypothetical protein
MMGASPRAVAATEMYDARKVKRVDRTHFRCATINDTARGITLSSVRSHERRARFLESLGLPGVVKNGVELEALGAAARGDERGGGAAAVVRRGLLRLGVRRRQERLDANHDAQVDAHPTRRHVGCGSCGGSFSAARVRACVCVCRSSSLRRARASIYSPFPPRVPAPTFPHAKVPTPSPTESRLLFFVFFCFFFLHINPFHSLFFPLSSLVDQRGVYE